VAAFFVTQRLKRSPAIVARAHFGPEAFSPNGDRSYDRTRVTFRLLDDDDVTVSVIDDDNDAVRTLVSGDAIRSGRQRNWYWNGLEDDGTRAPDGYYRARVALRHQGRSVIVPGVVRLDTERPEPRITSVQGRGARGARTPLFITHGHVTPLTVEFTGSTGRHSELLVERTDGRRPQIMARSRTPPRRHTLHWDGTVHGHPPGPGVYRLRIRLRDLAGNTGTSPARAPGIGVTVRGVAVQPPLAPVRAGRRARLLVDARGRRYAWSLRSVDSGRLLREGTGRRPRLRVRLPGGRAGLYELEARANGQRSSVPVAATAPQRHRVLVVLPALRWMGTDPVDDEGDGVPNTLGRHQPAPLNRVLAGLPPGFRANEARLLRYLDSRVHLYDLTTDAALAAGQGPKLAGHRGVLLAGQETWLPPALAAELRRWVQDGGTAATFAVRTLRRTVRLRSGVMSEPTSLLPDDAFRAHLGPIVHRSGALTAFPPDEVGLFQNTDGLFRGVPAYEPTRGVPAGTPLSAAGPDPRTPVILAYALDRGRVIRAGLPGWAGRLGSDHSVAGVTDRAWTLLSR
jgi:hypothetical protein